MPRFVPILAVGLVLSGCASRPPPGDGSPPWASLTSPGAALRVALDEVCLPAMLENRPLGELAQARYLRPVEPRSTGSAMATAAWRLGSWHKIFVMQLPNGGCSVSLEAGDADDLAALAVEMAQARAPLRRGLAVRARNGEAETVAWCADGPRPVVVSVLRKLSGRGPALVVNVFRAEADRPAFCDA